MAANLGIVITAKNMASGAFKSAGDAGEAMGSRIAGAGRVMAAGLAVGAAAVVGLGAAAFKLGGDFDSAYDAIRVGTGATGESLKSLQDDFKAVVKDVPTDFGTASQVLADLNTRTGQTGKGLQDLSKNILEMSRITKTDATANVALATRVFGDWGVEIEKQTGTLDMLFRASQSTGIGLGDLQAKVVQFGAPLRAMGFSLAESATMLGKWEKEGVNTELVLGSMRIAMGKFAAANIPMRTGLEQTMARIKELGPGAAATSLAMATFGARAGPDMAAAILEGRFALGDLLAQIEGGSETILKAAGDTADLGEKWQMTLNRLTVALEPVAMGVFDFANTLMDKAAPALEEFGKMLQEFTGNLSHLLSIEDPFSALVDSISMLLGLDPGAYGHAWEAIPDILADVGGRIMAQMQTWAQAFLTWVRPLIPPLIQQLAGLWARMETWLIGTALPKVVTTLASWGRAFVEWVTPMIPPLLVEAGRLLSSLLDWIVAEAPGLARTFIREWVPNAIKWVAQAAVDIVPKLLGLMGSVTGWILTTGIPMLVEAGFKVGQELIGGIMDGAGQLAGVLYNRFLDILEFDFGWIKLSARNGVSFNIPMPQISNPFGGGSDADAEERRRKWIEGGRQEIPRAAGGPVWAGASFLVGERGPELFRPSAPGTIIPDGSSGIDYDRLARILSSRPMVIQMDGRILARLVTTEQGYARSIG